MRPSLENRYSKYVLRYFLYFVFLTGISLGSFPAYADHDAIRVEDSNQAIQIAMTAAFVSESGVDIYSEITDYLRDKMKHEFEFISGFSYSTVDAMLDSGVAHIGFVCGLPYVLKHDQQTPSVELLVAPVMKDPKYKNQPKYFSYVIVHKDSPLKNFRDLQGHTYAYNDEISNSGFNMPRARLIEMGETNGFFKKVLRSGSHEESIRMVATGQVDASSVDSLVLDFDLKFNPEFAKQVKIIDVLGPAGIPPVVVSTNFPALWRDKIKELLVGMDEDPEGKLILNKALVNRFIVVDDSNYDDIRKMKSLAEKSGYLELR